MATWPESCRYFNNLVMDSAYLKAMFDRTAFRPGILQYLEVEDGRKGCLQQMILASKDERTAFARSFESSEADARFFFIELPQVPEEIRDGTTISLPQENWRLVCDLAEVHPCFIEQMQKVYSGGNAAFRTYATDGSLAALHLAVKVPMVCGLEAAIYFRFERLPRIRLIAVLLSSQVDSYVDCVSRHCFDRFVENAGFTVLLPILRQQVLFLRMYNRPCSYEVAFMEGAMGRGVLGHDTKTSYTPASMPLQRLHFLAGSERLYTFALNCHAELTIFLHNEISTVKELALFPPNGDIRDLLEALKFHHNLVDLQVSSARQGSMPRAQALLAAADSMISQSDAKSGAEIAIQSVKVAEESRKDSVSMKAVAVVTMMYLPTTFVATICSTIFFNVDSNGIVVDSKIWIFAVAAVLLTLLTIVTWLFLIPHGWRSIKELVGNSLESLTELVSREKIQEGGN